MSKLFDNNGAMFSEDRKYRYALFRLWELNKPVVMFIGLNPSTANEMTDDPTIRRVCRFARDFGYGGVYMMNLFGIASAEPAILLSHPDPVGENDKWLNWASEKCDDVFFAWGAFSQATERASTVSKMFPNAKCLIKNKDGTPRHPLYVPANTIPVIFNPPHLTK